MAQVQLTTDIKSFARGQVTSTTSWVAANFRTTTTTQPASGTNRLLVGSSLNYLKVKVLTEGTDTTADLAVYGWSFLPDAMAFVPQLLAQVNISSFYATAVAFPGVTNNVYEASTYSLSQGDAKFYNGLLGTSPGGFFLVDTLGCQFIEFNVRSSAANVYHILTAGL